MLVAFRRVYNYLYRITFNLVKRGRAICRLVREYVIRHDQGLLVFKGGASFGMSSEEQQKDR
jgi:hypothetical protein